MRAYQPDEYDEPVYDCRDRDVIVVGGGNTAVDAVRTAKRLGARTATLVYRRSEAEMPARLEEVKHAQQEGIEFRMLTAPVELVGDEKGWLTGAKCTQMELGRARRQRPPQPHSDQRLGVYPARQRSYYRRGHHGQSADPEHDSGPEDHPPQLHRGRSRDDAHFQAWRLCRRRTL